MHIFKDNDRVRIRYAGREVEGEVILASKNGMSLMLSFEAILGGYAGTMPVLFNEKRGKFIDLIESKTVEIVPA